MTTENRARAGSRQQVPENALKECPSCGLRRGNTRTDWTPITRDGQVVGYTCPTCPTWGEPIRREVKAGGGVRYLAVVGVSAGGGQRRQLKQRFATLEQAREWVRKVKADAPDRSKVAIDVYAMTVTQLCDRWLDARDADAALPGSKIRPGSVNGYRSAAVWLDMHLGKRLARDVSPGEVEAALGAMASQGGRRGKPLSHRSISYALLTLRSSYKYGMREGWVTSNPAAVAVIPVKANNGATVRAKVAAGAVLRWSPQQMAAFRAYADAQGAERAATEPWLRVGARLTLTGMRRSEVLGLDWEHVNVATGEVQVAASRVRVGRSNTTLTSDTKTDNSKRPVQADVIHPGTAAALRELWMAQGRPESGLVIRDAAGDPVVPDTFSRRFKGLYDGAGVPRLTSIHNVRHSIATTLQAAGVPDHQAAALLGHDTQTYRKFYLVTDDKGAASAASAAGKALNAV